MMKIPALVLALTALPASAANGTTAALDSAVNAMLDAAGSGNHQATKVVPIETAQGGADGFAQIVGPGSEVRRTTAVIEITAPSAFQISVLVPVSTFDASAGTFHRVYGVGVDALVNYRK
jgi:hypothetical protein